ncbi:hypothetical protein BC827DRAFT_1250373 [Russula dissimulans]|jgi:hypothetical protein|nr:hypothetical protein BC827DRAFT_1250373 [Russula dissimulans]
MKVRREGNGPRTYDQAPSSKGIKTSALPGAQSSSVVRTMLPENTLVFILVPARVWFQYIDPLTL